MRLRSCVVSAKQGFHFPGLGALKESLGLSEDAAGDGDTSEDTTTTDMGSNETAGSGGGGSGTESSGGVSEDLLGQGADGDISALGIASTIAAIECLPICRANEEVKTALGDAVCTALKKRALIALKPLISKSLQNHGLAWTDVAPALEDELVGSSPAELAAEAVDQPAVFMARLAQSGGPAVAKLVKIAEHKSELEPHTAALGITWIDVLRAISMVGTAAELQDALDKHKLKHKQESGVYFLKWLMLRPAMHRPIHRPTPPKGSKGSKSSRAGGRAGQKGGDDDSEAGSKEGGVAS
jgi:hypothetical protein